jgi:uncharacterized protein YdeI (BOF family)
MKRILVALSLAILAVPAFAANGDQNAERTEQQSGYFDPAQ